MFRYIILVYILAQLNNLECNPTSGEASGDKELVLAFIINRHGERAPDSDELSLSKEQERIKNLTYIEGPEGLTNVGKRRAYQIGKYMRQRYGSQGHSLISDLYLRDEIFIRSTDKERTKMTAQIAMAAAYPPKPEQQWDEGVGRIWQPVPYTAVPLSEDYLRYYSNCRNFIELMTEAKEQAQHEEFAKYDDLIPYLKEQTGKDFSKDPLSFQTLFDLFRSLVGLGLDIPEWAKPLLPRLGEAAKHAYNMYFRSVEMKRIGGGVLLNKFVSLAQDIMTGKAVAPRLYMFSAHDFNIGSLMEVANVKNENGIPEYGAVFSLELYRSRSTGLYSVLPVYLSQAGESTAQVLRISSCEGTPYCEYNRFYELSKDFLLPEREYYQLCKIKTEL